MECNMAMVEQSTNCQNTVTDIHSWNTYMARINPKVPNRCLCQSLYQSSQPAKWHTFTNSTEIPNRWLTLCALFLVLFLTMALTGAGSSWLAGPWFCSEQCQTSVLLCVGSQSHFRSVLRFWGPCLYSGSQVVRISGIYWGFPAIRILRIPKYTGEIYCLL